MTPSELLHGCFTTARRRPVVLIVAMDAVDACDTRVSSTHLSSVAKYEH